MIKTLHITSFIAVVLAILVFISPALFTVQNDSKIKEFLSSPDFSEKYKTTDTTKTQTDSQTSPLVQQAQALALHLDPPEPPKVTPRTSTNQNTVSNIPQADVSPKFKVLGTSLNANNPLLSQVFIDEPGSGKRWVKQSGTVGRLTIEQVRDGVVVVNNGQETFEVLIEKQTAATTPAQAVTKPVTSTSASSKPPVQATTQPKNSAPAAVQPLTKEAAAPKPASQPVPKSESSEQAMERLIQSLQNTANQKTASDRTDTGGLDEKEKAKMMEKLLSSLKAAQINDQETVIIDDLGNTMEKAQNEPNKTDN
jgi:hypothetical protein